MDLENYKKSKKIQFQKIKRKESEELTPADDVKATFKSIEDFKVSEIVKNDLESKNSGELVECEKIDDISFKSDEPTSFQNENLEFNTDNESQQCPDLQSSNELLENESQDQEDGLLKRVMDVSRKRQNEEEIPLKDREETNVERSVINVNKVVSNGQVLTTSASNLSRGESKKPSKCGFCCGPVMKCVLGTLCLVIGIVTIIWTPYEFLMKERLRMTPGLPAFDWWLKPPDAVFMKITLFNVTNGERFLAGADSKLELAEYGPITYLEKLEHSDIVFNENGTMSYTAKRWLEFLPEYNKGIDMNATLNVVNLPILGFASYISSRAPFFKIPFKLLLWSPSYPLIRKITAYEFLWNYTDPILLTGNKFLPGIVPIRNVGMLATMYKNFTDRVTVYIGTKFGDSKFFTLDNFQGRANLPGFERDSNCRETVQGSTEGLIYTQRLQRNMSLLYWRKSLCKVIALHYSNDFDFEGIPAFRYLVPNNTYHRTKDPSNPDCFAADPPLPNGLSDISKCYFNFPMALSLPHFYGTDPSVISHIGGLRPDLEKHKSYAIVEPTTGIPLQSRARSQSNLVMGEVTGFNEKISRFSNFTIPLFWAEYSQQRLPNYVWALIVMMVKVVPTAQAMFSTVMILAGLVFMYQFCKLQCCKSPITRHSKLNILAKKTLLGYENEKKKQIF